MQHSALKWSKISTSKFSWTDGGQNEMQILTKHYITISYINQLIPVSEIEVWEMVHLGERRELIPDDTRSVFGGNIQSANMHGSFVFPFQLSKTPSTPICL